MKQIKVKPPPPLLFSISTYEVTSSVYLFRVPIFIVLFTCCSALYYQSRVTIEIQPSYRRNRKESLRGASLQITLHDSRPPSPLLFKEEEEEVASHRIAAFLTPQQSHADDACTRDISQSSNNSQHANLVNYSTSPGRGNLTKKIFSLFIICGEARGTASSRWRWRSWCVRVNKSFSVKPILVDATTELRLINKQIAFIIIGMRHERSWRAGWLKIAAAQRLPNSCALILGLGIINERGEEICVRDSTGY